MKLFLSAFLFLVCFGSNLSAQERLIALETTLAEVSKSLFTNKNQAMREKSFNDIKDNLKAALKEPGSFAHPFDSLQHISIQYPQDSTFRIFTWQYYVNKNEYKYGGCIQEKAANKITFLADASKTFMDPQFDQTDAAEWYGSVYYKIYDFESERGKEYLLFGYNAYRMLESQKVVDVLSFESGSPQFGASAFYQSDAAKAEYRRLVYTFSAETSFKLNYDENLGLIIIDHLAPGTSIEGTSVWVADGTYIGYKLENNRWVYEDKLFHKILEEAPIERPILDERKGKDIFGNAQPNRNKPPAKLNKKKGSAVKLSKNSGKQR